MNMREKIARAICRVTYTSDACWEGYLPEAAAVLEALREPTVAMVSAADTVIPEAYGARPIFTAMIDAAREGK